MDGKIKDPIPISIKKFNYKIPVIQSVPIIGLRNATILIGVIAAITCIGLLVWTLMPPVKLAVIPALNLVWSILLIIGAVTGKRSLIWPALASSAIGVAILVVFVIIDGLIFLVLVVIEWKFSASAYLQALLETHIDTLDWEFVLFEFYLLVCLAAVVIGFWIIVYSEVSVKTPKNDDKIEETEYKFHSSPVEL
ncbi:hypothetical protein HA402_012799 [Bradysia odoriphaga]|nr:hypothetical protein HA402_012799 [Bradysia odoriphaga]